MIEKIKEVSKIITNKVSSSKISLENYISTENMISNFGGITIATSIPSGPVNSFEENDILLSNIRPYFRKTWFSNMSGGCSTDIIVLRANTEYILPKYLFYIFNTQHFVKYYVSSCKGTKMPRGNKDALSDYEINLPDIETQQHIVDTIPTLFHFVISS